MKANTTPKRIINLFQHPSKRFADTVGTIADQRIAAAGIAGGGLKHAGSIDGIDENLLTADNVGKVYNVGNEFTVLPNNTIFVETVDQDTTFPAGTNVAIVAVEMEGENDETETVYKFDILPGLPSSGSGVQMLMSTTPTGSDKITVEDVNYTLTPETVVGYRVMATISNNNDPDDIQQVDIANLCYLSFSGGEDTYTVTAIVGNGGDVTSMFPDFSLAAIDQMTVFVLC